MSVTWSDGLKTGSEWLDGEHIDLCMRIDGIFKCTKKGPEELSVLLKYIDSCMTRHFYEEEKAMERTDYPERPAHRSQHEQFKGVITGINEILHAENKSLQLSKNELFDILEGWISDHMAGFDKKFGVFLADKVRA